MIVTKPGIYRDAKNREVKVFDVGIPGEPWFRANHNGSYYNVNREPDNEPFDAVEWEMVEFVRDFIPSDFPVPRLPR